MDRRAFLGNVAASAALANQTRDNQSRDLQSRDLQSRDRKGAGNPADLVLLALDPDDFPHLRGAEQHLEPGVKHPRNPILSPRPGHWDGTRCKVYGTVLYDPADKLFKMWYSGNTDTPDAVRRRDGAPRHVGYAFSHDGVEWERPNLGVIEYNGSRENNLLELNAQAPCVLLRPEEPDPQRRFLMITETGMNTFRNKILHSPDGVRWTRVERQPIPSVAGGDSRQNFGQLHGSARRIHEPFSILHDPKEPDAARRWKGYSLLHITQNGYRGRAVGLFLGRDPENWVEYETQPIFSALDGMESEIHLPHVTRFHDTYVMLYDAMEPDHHTQTEVAVSRDGIRFRRVQAGVKLLANGRPGDVDAGKICVSPRAMFTHEGKIWWYYTVSPDTYQTGPRGLKANPWYRYTALAQWRQDGFASLRPATGADAAQIQSRPLEIKSGGPLEVWLNAVAPPVGGGLRIELVDAAGKEIARGKPWIGDQLRGAVEWAGAAPVLRAGQQVALRISCSNVATRLYAAGLGGAVRTEAPAVVTRPTADPRVRWTFRAEAKITAPPVVEGDTLYLTSWDQHLYAIDRASGSLRWKQQTGNSITTSPAVDKGSVYAASRDGNLYSFDCSKGTPQWRIPVSTGRMTASTNTSWVDCSPAIGEFTCGALPGEEAPRRLFIGCHNRDLHAFQLNDGAEVWRFPTYNWILGQPAVANYLVYFVSLDGRICAVDARCGALAWQYRVGKYVRYAPSIVPGSIANEGVAGAPLVDRETVYCGADDGFLYALDARTGEERWVYQTGQWIWGRPLRMGDMLVVASADGIVHGVDAESGKKIWQRAAGNALYADVVRSGKWALATSTSGTLLALVPETGDVAWTFRAESGIRAAPAVGPEGAIYLPTCGGVLYALRA
ncbi:MAG: PQQ-binding-like beta-propeller repeat protein [Bryobacteraceae bacterium]